MQQMESEQESRANKKQMLLKLTPKRSSRRKTSIRQHSQFNYTSINRAVQQPISPNHRTPSKKVVHESVTCPSIKNRSNDSNKSKRIRKSNCNYYRTTSYSMTSIIDDTRQNNPNIQITIPYQMKKILTPLTKKYTQFDNRYALNPSKSNFKVNFTKQQHNQEELKIYMRMVAMQQQKNLSQFMGVTAFQNITKSGSNSKYQSVIKIPQEIIYELVKPSNDIPSISEAYDHHYELHKNFHNFSSDEDNASSSCNESFQQEVEQIKAMEQQIRRQPSLKLKHRDSSKLLSDNYDNQLQCYMSCVMPQEDSPVHTNLH